MESDPPSKVIGASVTSSLTSQLGLAVEIKSDSVPLFRVDSSLTHPPLLIRSARVERRAKDLSARKEEGGTTIRE